MLRVYHKLLPSNKHKHYVIFYWANVLVTFAVTTSAFFASWQTLNRQRDTDGFFPSRVVCRIVDSSYNWTDSSLVAVDYVYQLHFLVLTIIVCTKSADLAYTWSCCMCIASLWFCYAHVHSPWYAQYWYAGIACKHAKGLHDSAPLVRLCNNSVSKVYCLFCSQIHFRNTSK